MLQTMVCHGPWSSRRSRVSSPLNRCFVMLIRQLSLSKENITIDRLAFGHKFIRIQRTEHGRTYPGLPSCVCSWFWLDLSFNHYYADDAPAATPLLPFTPLVRVMPRRKMRLLYGVIIMKMVIRMKCYAGLTLCFIHCLIDSLLLWGLKAHHVELRFYCNCCKSVCIKLFRNTAQS